MRAILCSLVLATLVPPALAQKAKPKEFAGILSGQPASFRSFIAKNEGKLVRLSVFFDAEPKVGKAKAGAVYEPYGYKGSDSLALFGVGDRTYWLTGLKEGKSWRKAPFWDDKKLWLKGTFRVKKNRRAGGGRWFDLLYVRPAGPPDVVPDGDPR